MRRSIAAQSCEVRPTGAGVDAEEGDVVGVRIAEEQVDLAARDLLLEGLDLALEVGRHTLVGLDVEHRGELAGVSGTLRQRFPGGEVIADARRLLVEGCGAARIVPEIRVGYVPIELDETDAFSVEVKDAPEARRCGRQRRRRGRQARS